MLEFLKIIIDGKRAEADERGATAVEYGLMVALIAIVIIAAVTILGNDLSALFKKVADSI